jgi:diguanylate cyclase (GGDEF)-like protein
MTTNHSITVNQLDISWDEAKGICTLADIPVTLMWVDTTLLGLMSSVQSMVGTERFLLSLQNEGRKSVEDDWSVISSFDAFEDGFNEIVVVAQVAGWGIWTLVDYDKNEKRCVFRVENSWEGRYQRTIGKCWGSGFVAGKFAGYCTKLFGDYCWPKQTSYIAKGDLYDEFVVSPSSKRVESEIDKLLTINKATQADMAVALEQLRNEVNERKHVAKKLSEQKKYYESLLSNLNFPTLVIDAEHKVVLWNKACEKMTGISGSDIIGGKEPWRGFYKQSRPCLADLVLDESLGEMSLLYDCEFPHPFISEGKRTQGWCEMPTGELLYLDMDAAPTFDENGSVTAVIEVLRDITEHRKIEEKLNFQARHDALTKLANRYEFEQRGIRLVEKAKENGSEHALCFLNLDQFKVVNDTCGHSAGDEMLRQISQVLQRVVRKEDTLARLGGDEFGILMECCSITHAYQMAAVLQKNIQEYQLIWKGQSFRVGVSIGLVALNRETVSINELLTGADAACYMAKDFGRNRIHVYEADDKTMTERRGEMQWVNRIRQALEQDRFCLYAQSILSLDGDTHKHYEILIRMIDEKGDIIAPGAFLPAAERYNLIIELDRWVVTRVFSLLRACSMVLDSINFISVNLSGDSLTDEDFLKFVIEQLRLSSINGEKICFEITETAAISNLEKAGLFIEAVKDFGCRFALDDFGSGLSSFGYLKKLPVDYLKIDGMFVKDMVNDKIDCAMVKSINEIGHIMDMQTIAEFVENDAIKDMLIDIGINYAQGFGIDKPKPFEEILNSLKSISIL